MGSTLTGYPDTMLLAFVLALAGAAIGSFAGAAALRLAREDSVVTGRSRCDSCGRMLRVGELVPILSFLVLSGRCRGCGAPIDRVQPLAEVAGAALGVGAALFLPDAPSAILAALLSWQLLVLGLSDWRSFHLPPTGIAILGVSALLVPVRALIGGEAVVPVLLQQVAGGGLGYVLLAAPALAFRALRGREGMGSADPPLMAAIGLWMGPIGVCFIVLLGAAIGIVAALVAHLRRWRRNVDNSGPDAGSNPPFASDSAGALPLGSLLALATIAVCYAGISIFAP